MRFKALPPETAPPAINVTISFDEALKLHLGLGQILGKLNTYSRSTKAGRDAGVNLCVFTAGTPQITINEGRVKPGGEF